MPQVIAGNVLTAGLRQEMADTYLKVKRESDARLSLVMDLNLPSDKRQEIYAFFRAAPHAARWDRGDAIPTKGFEALQYTVTNFKYGRRVGWHIDDREDDQTQTLVDQARNVGRSFAMLPERFFFELLTGTADLLPSVPTSADGAAFFATTALGTDRFGVTDGNLLTGSGVASATAIRSDFWNTMEQYRLMQDGEGQPLHSDDTVDGGAVIIYNAANEEVFRETFLQGRTFEEGSVGGAAVTNTILESGMKVTLWSTQRLTDNDWFVFLKQPPKKAAFVQNRTQLREYYATAETSDRARDTGEEYIQWDQRMGVGINEPYGAVKVNN